ncbi:MFS general substrate transporter [Clavulina sp. PMI_390]|nr:MFS general substrate transporter [Clavulina sp. PMI_390]
MADIEQSSFDEKKASAGHFEHVDIVNASKDDVPTLTEEEERQLYRKIDRRLLPILSLMYLLSFMDRGNIGNAKLEGLLTSLHMSSTDYTVALVMFFVPYCICEPISNLAIKRVRPSIYLPTIGLVWGTIMTMMGLVKTYHQLIGVRVCLGVAEAGLFPGVVYVLTFWYPRHMMQLRIGLFFGAATIAGAFSGLLAYGISFMSGTRGLKGWSWIFILEGIATVGVALLAFVVLHGCDSPETASFLTPKERAFVSNRQRHASGSVAAEDDSLDFTYVWKALSDWQVWLSILTYMSVVVPLYACALFLPSIINGFGYSTPVSQLLTVPPFTFASICLIIIAYYSDKTKTRYPFILFGQTVGLIGFIINISPAPRGVKYFGMFLCTAGIYGSFPGVVAWLGNNLSPSLKRGIGMALQIGIGNFGGAISSSVYRTKDQPRYILGHSVVIGFLCMGLITGPLTVVLYRRINAKRDEMVRSGVLDQYSEEDLSRMGDRAPNFRYVI